MARTARPSINHRERRRPRARSEWPEADRYGTTPSGQKAQARARIARLGEIRGVRPTDRGQCNRHRSLAAVRQRHGLGGRSGADGLLAEAKRRWSNLSVATIRQQQVEIEARRHQSLRTAADEIGLAVTVE